MKWMLSESYALFLNSSPHCRTTAFGSMSVPLNCAATVHEDHVPIECPLTPILALSTYGRSARYLYASMPPQELSEMVFPALSFVYFSSKKDRLEKFIIRRYLSAPPTFFLNVPSASLSSP